MSEATALATVGCQLNSTLRWFQDAVLPDAITTPPPLPTSLSGTRRICIVEGEAPASLVQQSHSVGALIEGRCQPTEHFRSDLGFHLPSEQKLVGLKPPGEVGERDREGCWGTA